MDAYLVSHNGLGDNLYMIGESKIQETEQKFFNFQASQKTQIHLIGRLQSNKAKKAVKIYDIIHSVHKIQLLDKINHHAQKKNKQQQIFIQLKLNPNPTQIGFLKHEILLAAQHATTLSHIKLIGIMAIGPHTNNETKIKKGFDTTKAIQQYIYQKINKNCINLSMGMSQDYVLALQLGATHIRIGTKLFIKRNE